MKAIFYDTETTGLPLFSEPSEDSRQPHIAQLGALLVDLDARKVLSSVDLIIRPDGWSIPEDVSKIHGITTEHAMDVGVPEALAVEALLELWDRSDLRIGHNEQFDARILRIATLRFPNRLNGYTPDDWKEGAAECTLRLATPIMKLPPTDKMRASGRSFFKGPKLTEAFEFFTGRNLVDAHSAMADARACMAVYFAIKDRDRPDPSAGSAPPVATQETPAP